MGVAGRRTKDIPGAYIECGIGVSIRIDVCGRICECRLCTAPIKAGERRFCITNKVTGRQMKNGGTAFKLDRFYHPACFIKFIQTHADAPVDGDVPEDDFALEDKRTCVGCNATFSKEDSRKMGRVRLSSRFAWEPLCGACVTTGLWKQCEDCHTYVHMHSISGGKCDLCADIYDLMTPKKIKAKERRAEKERRQFEALRESLQERYVQED